MQPANRQSPLRRQCPVPQATRCVLAQTTHHRWSVAARRMAARSPVRPQLATDPEVIPACRSTQRSQALAAHLRRGRQQRCRPLPRSRPRARYRRARCRARKAACTGSGAEAASSRAPDPRSACARPPPAPPRRRDRPPGFRTTSRRFQFRFQTQQRRRPPVSAARALPHPDRPEPAVEDRTFPYCACVAWVLYPQRLSLPQRPGRAGPTLLGNPK